MCEPAKRYREYVITKFDETVDEAEHAIVTMDGVEVYRTYFEQDNWPRIVEAAVVASKRTAAWFDQQSTPTPSAGDEREGATTHE